MKATEMWRWRRDEYEGMISHGLFAPEEQVELIDGEILKVPPQGSARATAVRLTEDSLRALFSTGCDARAGIQEYWPINLAERCVEVYRDPGEGAYRSSLRISQGESLTPLAAPQARLAVADIVP